MRLLVWVIFFGKTRNSLTNPLLHAIHVMVVRDQRVTDIGSQSADTIKLHFIRGGRLGIAYRGSASLIAGRSRQRPNSRFCRILLQKSVEARGEG
jgi:hypothetical protein